MGLSPTHPSRLCSNNGPILLLKEGVVMHDACLSHQFIQMHRLALQTWDAESAGSKSKLLTDWLLSGRALAGWCPG